MKPSKIVQRGKCRRGFSLLDVVIASVVLIVAILGTASYRYGSALDERKAVIYGLDTCTSISFKNNSTLYAAIYAPKAAIVYNNGVPLYGSIIAKSFETKNSAAIHYDASLRDVTVNDTLTVFKIKTWSEN